MKSGVKTVHPPHHYHNFFDSLAYLIPFSSWDHVPHHGGIERWSIAHNGKGVIISTNQTSGFLVANFKTDMCDMKWKDYGCVPLFTASTENL